MATKDKSSTRRTKAPSAAEIRIGGSKHSHDKLVVKFGAVTVTTTKPNGGVISQNVTKGADALARAVSKMSSPGVTLETKADVPTFRAAPENPKIVIRSLNGKEERGQMNHGKFVASE